MRHDGPFRSPAPLTAIESARRAAALKANQESDQTTVITQRASDAISDEVE